MVAPLALIASLDEIRWTGVVRAYGVYADLDRRPEEEIATIVLARKTYADGSTTTLIRQTPRANLDGRTLSTVGSMVVERSPEGVSTRIASSHGYRWPVGVDADEYDVRAGAKGGPLTGDVRHRGGGSWVDGKVVRNGDATASVTLPALDYVVDPLEAVAFRPEVLRSGGWTAPWAPSPGSARPPGVARYALAPLASQALKVGGIVGDYRVLDLRYADPRSPERWFDVGVLLVDAQGRMVARLSGARSGAGAASSVALEGLSRRNPRLLRFGSMVYGEDGVIAERPVSPSEEAEALAAIPPKPEPGLPEPRRTP